MAMNTTEIKVYSIQLALLLAINKANVLDTLRLVIFRRLAWGAFWDDWILRPLVFSAKLFRELLVRDQCSPL